MTWLRTRSLRRIPASSQGCTGSTATRTVVATPSRKTSWRPVVDDPAAQALRVLISCDQSRMTLELGHALTRFAMSLMVRHPTAIDQITERAARDLKPHLLQDPAEYEFIR
jgi:hypothetical protein